MQLMWNPQSKNLALLNSFVTRWQRTLEWTGFSLISGFFVLRWWGRFYLTPDAGHYLTSAINLVHRGTFFVYINWPVRTMVPGTQIYADFPPGFPSYLSVFLFFFHDPLLAAGIAQSVALLALFGAVYKVTSKLGMNAPFKLLTVFFLGMFTPHRNTLESLLTEPLYLFLCFAVLLCALDIAEKGDNKNRWARAFLFLFLASAVRWNGFACISFFVVPLWKNRRYFWRKSIFLCTAGALPISLWFVRNMFQLGQASAFYGRPQILLDRLMVPFVASVYWWGFGSIALTLAIFGAAWLPVLTKKIRASEDLTFFWIIWAGAIAQFLVIYGLSLVILGMTPVNDRYLMPAYFLFSVVLFYSINLILRRLHLLPYLWVASLVVTLAASPFVAKKLMHADLSYLGQWTIPVEAKLWQQIKDKPYFEGATHFYSNENHLHQIFALKPQVVLWNEHPERNQLKTWASEPHSFFVIGPKSPLIQSFADGLEAEIPDLKKEVIEGFTVYFRGSESSPR